MSRGEVDVDVVREGKKGFLGFGQEESIIRVTLKEGVVPGAQRAQRGRYGGRGGARSGDRSGVTSAHESEEERQRSEGAARAALEAREGGFREGGADAGGDETGDRAPTQSRSRSRGRRGGRGRDGAREGTSEAVSEGAGEGARAERPTLARDDRPRAERPALDRDDRPRADRRGPRRGGSIELPVRVPGAPDELPLAPITDPEDELDLAGRTLRDVLTLLGLSATDITARDPETPGDGLGLMTQVFDIMGSDEDASEELGVLIGRRGETLQSLQYLLNVIVSSRYDGEQIFAVDIEQYRRRREQALVDLAHRIAGEVRETGDVITLEPMPAAERRIVHLALQEEEGVRTESVGRGTDRQVEIMPA